MAMQAPLFSSDDIARCVEIFRVTRPHVHCITNSVAQHFTANVILAAGGKASMTIAPNEVASFVEMADALLINLGTMDAVRQQAILIAVEAATLNKKPWALDPVFVHGSPTRLEFAKHCLSKNPDLIRCNAAEAKSLFGENDLAANALEHQTLIAMTGETDWIADGKAAIKLSNGSKYMDQVTAMGCALNALMIGFLAIEKNRLLASASALSLYNICGEIAEEKATGPGTFVPHFLDALATTTPETIASKVVFS